MKNLTLPCPCGRPALYTACCRRWHVMAPGQSAPDAESLMRSRYSAFVFGLTDYLIATWHPSTRPAALDVAEPGLRWLGLEVRKAWSASASEAYVEFVARSRLGGRAHRLHETSRFLADDGRWFYVDGVIRAGGG